MQSSLGLSLILFFLYLGIILLVLRRSQFSPTVIVCGCALLVYITGVIIVIAEGLQINFFSFSSLYWFLTLNLLMFFGAIYKSISLRIMLYLFNQVKKADSYDIILENYIKNQSYHNRIDILVENEMIKKVSQTSFSLTKKGDSFARKLRLIQKIFAIKESG